MGKKKSFIDKKNSSTFHLLYRSQRDVGGGEDEDDGGVVLWPSPENNPATNEKVLQSGASKNTSVLDSIVDDYDYEKHMKPITGTGDYFSSNNGRENALQDPRARIFEDAATDVKEVERQLDSIALTADCMDEDVALALFGDFEEGGFEEILDDFCVTAAQPGDEEEEETGGFDYNSHIEQLIENSNKRNSEKGVMGDDSKNHPGRNDEAFFSKLQPLREYDDDGDYSETLGVAPALSPDEEKALCEKFALTLAEYDSDEVGELEEDDDLRVGRPLEGDRLVQSVLDDYLVEKKDDIFMEGSTAKMYREGGSAFHTLPHKEGDDEVRPMAEVLAEAREFLRGPEIDVPPEEILIDGQSYFSQRSVNPWDVDSVLSTYSNLDNNPVTIAAGSRKKKKKKKQQPLPIEEGEEEHQQQHIQLSNKTGLPLGVLPTSNNDTDFDFDTIASVNKGIKRDKTETDVQKKLRKQQVKQERLMARIQKKMMKEAFGDEFMKASHGNDELAGKSVYRFS